ncbi:MAG: PAS domain S-box protein [Mucilaginibacter sp.]
MLNHILATINDYVLAFNQDENRYLFISNNIAELAGYSAADFEKNHDLWQQSIDPRDAWKVKGNGPITEGNHYECTYRIKTRSGKTKWVNEKLSLFKGDEGGGNIAMRIIRDIQREDEAKYNQEEAMTGYSLLFDNNPSPMMIYELATLRILKVNASAIETYGYTRDELLTMTIHDLRQDAGPEDPDEYGPDGLFRGFNKLRKHVSKTGETIYMEITSDSITYKNRDCRIVIATNVTEKIRWREEVKLREQFLNSLIDSQTNFLIRIDIQGNFTFVNKQFLKVFGYQKHEIIGKHYSITTIPEELPKCQAAFVECMDNPNKITHLTHKKPDKEGKLHDTEWEFIAIKNEDGQVTGGQGIGRDITERINEQKELVSIKSNLEALINNTEDLIWSVDREYRYLSMNEPYKSAIVGHIGHNPTLGESVLHTSFPPELLAKWLDYYNRGVSGERYAVLTESKMPSGETNYFETGFNPIYNEKGEITGVGCFSRNITERVKTTKALTEQNERLQNIASLSSHELRRPVATMLGLIEILDKEDFYNPENMQIIEHIISVGLEIDNVIRLIVDTTFI